MKTTLITMGAGNVLVLRKTLESVQNFCDEVIYGDLLLFPEDRKIVESYQKEFNLKIVPFQFNYIFNNGFDSILNALAARASNDLVLYLNTSEIVEIDNGIQRILDDEYNAYFFDHATDPHRWYRFYNRHELKWSGNIHESLVGEYRPYHKPIFRMADLEKDMISSFKAIVLNDVKEIVYFKNYMKMVEDPAELKGTDEGWMKFATENYDSFKERLEKKGLRYRAFLEGDFEMYWADIYDNIEFSKQRFESNIGIEYQGDPQFLGKK